MVVVLLGCAGSALSLTLPRVGTKVPTLEPVRELEGDSQDREQSWAQHDSILHDLSNAMTASLFMVRDLSRALDKGTEPGLRRARSLSQELVGELSQIGEHIKSSRQSVRLQPIVGSATNLVEPVARCVEIVARLYSDVNCRVECSQSASVAMVSIIGGEATLKRVIENLVINACQVERTRAPKEIVCRIAVVDDIVSLSVEDNGIGFPQVVLDSYPSPKVSTKAQGSGIGLYSCHQLVKRDGGTLEICNPNTGGALVTASWPRARTTPREAIGSKDSNVAISGTRARPDHVEQINSASNKR